MNNNSNNNNKTHLCNTLIFIEHITNKPFYLWEFHNIISSKIIRKSDIWSIEISQAEPLTGIPTRLAYLY